MLSSARSHGLVGTLNEVGKWALPRLAMYLAAAAIGAILFLSWAVVYTYVWPTPAVTSPVPAPKPIPSRYVPLSVDSPSKSDRLPGAEIPMVQLPPVNTVPQTSAANFELRYIGAVVFGPGGEPIGKVNDVLFSSNGNPEAIIVSCNACGVEKGVAVPFKSVKWEFRSLYPIGPIASSGLPNELPLAFIQYSASDLRAAPPFP